MDSLITSDIFTSEGKREGLKYIAQAVSNILKEKRECTYQYICKTVNASNSETANRRIYDVLNVMRAVNLIGRREKVYYMLDNVDDIKKKRNEAKKLMEMRDTFTYITTRNELLSGIHSERLYLPFMIISTDKRSEINCDTNEERTFFLFKSNRPLKVIEDLGILKEIREQSKEDVKQQSKNLLIDSFMF